MHVAIDDTYGPEGDTPSRHVTGARRTYVAVEIPDSEVEEVRDWIREFLKDLRDVWSGAPQEFHFSSVYNRRDEWKSAPPGKLNLEIVQQFAEFYARRRWRVHIQTVDERTIDGRFTFFSGAADGIGLTERSGQALFMLLVKVKNSAVLSEPLTLLVDEGLRRAGAPFAHKIFREWEGRYAGQFASSHREPLLQLADFLAFCINRCTILGMKAERSDTDLWFMQLIARMDIRADELKKVVLSADFSVEDFDAVHDEDRRDKGLS
jgi:hypothetical protein